MWKVSHIQQENVEYLKGNAEHIVKMNRSTLLMANLVYLLLLILYSTFSRALKDNTMLIITYGWAILLQLVVAVIIYVRHRALRSATETTITCCVFQMYVMGFVTYISVFPVGMENKPIYIAPIAIAFSIIFIFSWYTTLILSGIEIACFLMLAYYFRPFGSFMEDVFICVMTMCLTFLCSYQINVVRISENHSKNQIRKIGMIDKLTGLYNKASAETLCKEYLKGLEHTKEGYSLLIIDFDNFKDVNDTFGHSQGDEVLKEFGRILREVVRESDIAGRIGGDEFMVLLKDCQDKLTITSKAEHILEKTHQILETQTVYPFSCSIGISVVEKGQLFSYERVFSEADRALYRMKKAGKNGMRFFDAAELDQASKKTILVVDDLIVSRAILRSCFEDDCTILEAENGEEAFQIIKKKRERISVMLLDIEMPIINGYQLLANMKEQGINDFPILIITAHADSREKAISLGAVDVIMKPFDPIDVKQKVWGAIHK